jgi:hypothetical protein
LEAFKKEGIFPKRPILRAATRWNSAEMMLDRVLYILPVLKHISDHDMPISGEDQQSFSSLVRDVELYAKHIDAIVPVLNKVSQWTQALSTNGHITISLVPLAVKQIQEQIHIMASHAVDFRVLSDRNILTDLEESLTEQLDNYFSADSLAFYCYSVSAFLDPRVYATLNEDEKLSAIHQIKNELVAEEHDEHSASVSAQERVISEDERIMARMLGKRIHEQNEEISGGGSRGGISTGNGSKKKKGSSSSSSSTNDDDPTVTNQPTAIDLEIAEYIKYIIMNPNTKDPLVVWPWLTSHAGLKILPLVARRLFAIPACSSDVERLFSKAGYFVNPRRNQLGSETLNELLVLNAFYTYRHSFLPRDVRNTQRTQKLEHFVSFCCNSSSLNYDNYLADDILESDEALDKDMSDSEEEIDD